MAKRTIRHRLTTVSGIRRRLEAIRMSTHPPGGSSSVFRNELAASSDMRSASRMTNTRRPARTGFSAALRSIPRTDSMGTNCLPSGTPVSE